MTERRGTVETGPGFHRLGWPRILRPMGRLLLKVAAAIAAVIVVFWLLSVIIGLLVWVVMIGLVVGVIFLGVRMLKSDSGLRS